MTNKQHWPNTVLQNKGPIQPTVATAAPPPPSPNMPENFTIMISFLLINLPSPARATDGRTLVPTTNAAEATKAPPPIMPISLTKVILSNYKMNLQDFTHPRDNYSYNEPGVEFFLRFHIW